MEEDSVDIVFHGSAYNLAVTVHEDAQPEPTLAVDLEDLTSPGGALSWHGEFSASYLENITSKTGSFKRFPVLVKMLMGALRQQTEHVFLDLLTYADLVRGEREREIERGTGGNRGGTRGVRGHETLFLGSRYLSRTTALNAHLLPLLLSPLPGAQEALRSKKAAAAAAASSSKGGPASAAPAKSAAAGAHSNKRYLILTYVVEFDR